MPFTYRIEPDTRTMHVSASGIVTQDERLSAIRAWQTDPAYRPDLNLLCDFSEAVTAPSLAELRDVVAAIASGPSMGTPRRLAVIPGRPVLSGIARQFHSLLGDDLVDMQMFEDRVSALDWLHSAKPPS